MTIGFSIFFHLLKGEKNLKNQDFTKVIQKFSNIFFKYDPTYGICSHVLPFDAKLFIFYMKVMNVFLIRLGKRVRPKNYLKLTLV